MPKRAGNSARRSSSSSPRRSPWRTTAPGSTVRSWSNRRGCTRPRSTSGLNSWNAVEHQDNGAPSMEVGSLVERIELTDRAATWMVTNRRHLSPTFWIIATLTPLIVFWIGPLALQDSTVRKARSAHSAWVQSGRIPLGQVMAPREFLTGLRQLGPPPHLPDLSANGLEMGRVSFVPPADDGLAPSTLAMQTTPAAASACGSRRPAFRISGRWWNSTAALRSAGAWVDFATSSSDQVCGSSVFILSPNRRA